MLKWLCFFFIFLTITWISSPCFWCQVKCYLCIAGTELKESSLLSSNPHNMSKFDSFLVDINTETCQIPDLPFVFVYNNYVQLEVVSQSGILTSLCILPT